MFRKILTALFGVFIVGAASAGPVVNVEYIHQKIAQVWGIDIPYNPDIENVKNAANMKYLLTAVDAANRQLNKVRTSDYASGEFATVVAVDTVAADMAVNDLVRPIQYHFTATTTETSEFSFKISAAGTFYIDWGDGHVEKIEKANTTNTTYAHTYDAAGVYDVRFAGRATGYTSAAAISFVDNLNLAGIDGSLGRIFSTLASGANPRFSSVFSGCTNLADTIPEELFDGVSGQMVYGMFSAIFYNCSKLKGSIPGGLFSGLSGAPSSVGFHQAFQGCSGLTGSIPENLFTEYDADGNYVRGLQGAPASTSFSYVFYRCSGLTGAIPEKLFAGIKGAPNVMMFSYTFFGCKGLTGTIPENLFAGIDGKPADSMYWGTFYGCSGLTGEIPAKIFGKISGPAAFRMYETTFLGCSGLTGSIPAGLFGEITGAPQIRMYQAVFQGCSNLSGAIPDRLFGTFDGAPAQQMFESSFHNCSNLTGSIPENLFAGIKGKPAVRMYHGVFTGCSKLTGSIPAGLFGEISGVPIANMYSSVFAGCGGLTGSIPDKLFGEFNGAPAYQMFSYTFQGCGKLTGEIPENLFAGIKGKPASGMYQFVFKGCVGLTGSIPAGLFGEISGAPAEGMYYQAFYDCKGLTGAIPDGLFGEFNGAPAVNMFRGTFAGCPGFTSIPENLFAGISGNMASGAFGTGAAFSGTFYNCTGLTGSSPKIDGKYLYEIWPDAESAQVGTMYAGAKGLADYSCIPSVWGGLGNATAQCVNYPFTVTTTYMPADSVFDLSLASAGTFFVNWGDGSYDTIQKPDAVPETYSHTYATDGVYDIKIAGKPTEYPEYTDETLQELPDAVISFANNLYVAGISGNLAEVFPTLADGTNPNFYRLFSGCSNLSGAIPETLFAGLYGDAVVAMFAGVFENCAGLTEIPTYLFAGVTKPNVGMFTGTFIGCTGITAIPENLLLGLEMPDVPPRGMFMYMFQGSRNLQGQSLRLNGDYLYDLYPDVSDVFNEMYSDATGLTDYADIPASWK